MTSVESALRRLVADLNALKARGHSSAAWPSPPGRSRGSPKDLDFAVAVADDSQAEDVVHRLQSRNYAPVEILEQDYVKRLSGVRMAHGGSDVVIDRGQIIAEGTPIELKASVGSTVVEIRVTDPAGAQRAAARLQPIAPAGVLDGGRTLAVKVPDKGPAVQEIIRLLDADAIVVESLAIREPSLHP